MYSAIFLQAAGGGYEQFILLGGMILVFYLFMIRPQQTKQKKQREFVQEMKKGDFVVTAGGMHGKIISVAEHTVTLEVDKGINIKFEKGSISLENTSALNSGDKKATK
ncbi:MAG: preprotein translocase subunit YajC [Flammeovirgaceae bacterium]